MVGNKESGESNQDCYYNMEPAINNPRDCNIEISGLFIILRKSLSRFVETG